MLLLKVNKIRLLLGFIFLFLLTNLFKDIMPKGTNQLTGGCIVLLTLWNMLPIKKTQLVVYGYFFASALLAVCFTDDIGTHFKYFVYYILNISIFMLFNNSGTTEKFIKQLIKYKGLMNCIVLIFVLTITVMLALPQCYSTDLWDGKGFFQGFSVPHGVAGSCCLALSIIILLMNLHQRNKYLYLAEILVLLFAIVKAGTRTYLIAAAALLLLAVFSLAKRNTNRRFLMFIGLFAFIIAIVNSDTMRNKIEYAMNFQKLLGWNFFQAFTSSRTIIWGNDIKLFFTQSNLLQILFGGGFAYSYEINESWTYRIQAHNGFIEVLMSTGIIGLIIYLKILIHFLKTVSLKNKWFLIISLLYIPAVIFWDDILQAPSYMMSFAFIICTYYCLNSGIFCNYPVSNSNISKL